MEGGRDGDKDGGGVVISEDKSEPYFKNEVEQISYKELKIRYLFKRIVQYSR